MSRNFDADADMRDRSESADASFADVENHPRVLALKSAVEDGRKWLVEAKNKQDVETLRAEGWARKAMLLEAALREIAAYGGGDGGDWVECCEIARVALGGKP